MFLNISIILSSVLPEVWKALIPKYLSWLLWQLLAAVACLKVLSAFGLISVSEKLLSQTHIR